jgi:Flp pilus assembly protein protease CpaA
VIEITVYSVVFVICAIMAYIDIKTKTVNQYLVLCLAIIGLIYCFLREDAAFYIPIFCCIIFFLLSLAANKMSNGQLGFGDVKVITVFALIFSYPNIFTVLIYSLVTCLAYGLFIMIFKKKSLRTEIPFVPFLAIGNFLMIVHLLIAKGAAIL